MKALRYRGIVLAMAAVMVLAAAAGAEVFLLSFWGFDYWSPADTYNAVGEVPSVNADYLSFDYLTYEYTYAIQGVQVTSMDSVSVPGWTVIYMAGGTFDVYCDPLTTGTMADFGVNPPSATSPATFIDGENVFGGDFTSITIFWDTMSGYAQLDGTMEINRGTQLANIPPAQRTGWTLAALRQLPPEVPIPEGYFWQIDGQLYIDDPIPTKKTSWGQIKQQFRGGE